jgi:hypothetical protein
MYYINSNTGDYIEYNERLDRYTLTIVSIYLDEKHTYNNRIGGETLVITEQQFHHLKGFLPIKYKKLFNRKYRCGFDYYNTYCPTVKGGFKQKQTEIIKVPSASEIRDIKIKQILEKDE